VTSSLLVVMLAHCLPITKAGSQTESEDSMSG
jgi:hypothetical protein